MNSESNPMLTASQHSEYSVISHDSLDTLFLENHRCDLADTTSQELLIVDTMGKNGDFILTSDTVTLAPPKIEESFEIIDMIKPPALRKIEEEIKSLEAKPNHNRPPMEELLRDALKMPDGFDNDPVEEAVEEKPSFFAAKVRHPADAPSAHYMQYFKKKQERRDWAKNDAFPVTMQILKPLEGELAIAAAKEFPYPFGEQDAADTADNANLN